MWKPCVCNVSTPTLRECALFRKRSFWLAEYGLGYSVWLDMAGVKRKHQLVLTWGQCLSVWQDLCTLRGVSQPRTLSQLHCHTHNNTYLHVHTHAQTHKHNGHTALCKSTTTDHAQTSSAVIIPYQNSNVEQHFFVAFSFLLSVYTHIRWGHRWVHCTCTRFFFCLVCRFYLHTK